MQIKQKKKYWVVAALLIMSNQASANCTSTEINIIQNNLNSARTIMTDFLEESGGDLTKKQGRIYVSKPGKMRIDYNSPERLSIIINHGVVTYYDHQLEELTKTKHEPKFLSFLSKQSIDFAKDFESFECISHQDNININLWLEANNDEKMKVQMRFLKYNLNNVEIESNEGEKLTLHFRNFMTNVRVEETRFIFKDKQFFNIE